MKRFFGKKAVLEAYKLHELDVVYYVSFFDEINKMKLENIKLIKVNKDFFKKFDINHQFIMGISNNSLDITDNFEIFLSKINKQKTVKKVILILDEIHDSGNFGAICRTCKAFEISGLIFKKNNQIQINETVIKTSLGAVNYLNFLKVANILNTINKLKKQGYWVICSTLNDSAIALSKFKTSCKNLVLVVGNENKGVSNLIQKEADFLVKIEMSNDIDSLNVAVSTAIALYYLKNNF